MEKIAIPTENDRVAAHFGRCPQYTLVKTDGREITEKEVIPNPGHQPGFLPRYLKEKGVDCVMAAGMGMKAKDLFDSADIRVVTGVTGSVDTVLDKYLHNNLEAGENICDH